VCRRWVLRVATKSGASYGVGKGVWGGGSNRKKQVSRKKCRTDAEGQGRKTLGKIYKSDEGEKLL